MSTGLKIMTWNIMIPVLPPLRYFGQYERIHRIPEFLAQFADLDVVVFNELIPSTTHTALTNELKKQGFQFTTERLSDILAESGGVSIYSKFPILEQNFVLFGADCAISDCLSSKGVVYAKIDKNGFVFNVLGTHLQAGEAFDHIRESQINTIYKFKQELKLDVRQPVIVCGDTNMDLFRKHANVRHAAYKLNLNIPALAEDSHPFTFDPKLNLLVGIDDPTEYKSKKFPNGCVDEYFASKRCDCCPQEWLDYIMFANDHQTPKTCSVRAITTQVEPFDMGFTVSQTVKSSYLSDHFPVLARFEFDNTLSDTNAISQNPNSSETHVSQNPNSSQSALFIVLIIVAILVILFLAFVLFRKVRVWPAKSTMATRI